MKFQSVAQTEDCIIHVKQQVAAEACGFDQDVTGWSSLVFTSFSGPRRFSVGCHFYFSHCLSSLFIPFTALWLWEDFCKRKHWKEHILGPNVKGTFTFIIENLPPAEWLNASIKVLAFFMCVWKQTENFKPQLYLVVYNWSKMHYYNSIIFFKVGKHFFLSALSYKKPIFSKGKPSVFLSNYSKHIYRI